MATDESTEQYEFVITGVGAVLRLAQMKEPMMYLVKIIGRSRRR
jgi:hypothetical protein